jgi:hypothetical protein
MFQKCFHNVSQTASTVQNGYHCVQFDGSMSTGTVLDDDDRFAGLDRVSLVAPDGTSFTLADITEACKARSQSGNDSTPIARPDATQLLAPPGRSDDPAARLNPAMLTNQVWVIERKSTLTMASAPQLATSFFSHRHTVVFPVRDSACMHVRANGQQHLYCGCTVGSGGFASISISSARVRLTVVNDNHP